MTIFSKYDVSKWFRKYCLQHGIGQDHEKKGEKQLSEMIIFTVSSYKKLKSSRTISIRCKTTVGIKCWSLLPSSFVFIMIIIAHIIIYYSVGGRGLQALLCWRDIHKKIQNTEYNAKMRRNNDKIQRRQSAVI